VLATKIFSICRSITGNGVRQTLSQIGAHVALETYEVPTGTKVFDWTIPREWNIRDTYIKDSRGERIVDFTRSNLHAVSYSVPCASTYLSQSLVGTFTRCRDNSTLSLIAPRIMLRTGDSTCPIVNSNNSVRRCMRCLLIQASKMDI
jgi:uncharacterized protein DUF4910/uncharacterized protein DUF2172